jgi:hypothetical protein
MNILIPIKQQVDKCRQIIRKWFPENKNEVTKSLYTPLSPTDSAEDCDVYLEALSWALSNKKRIKNIAISGPYGSGKSSILQTFIKKEEQQSLNNRKWFSKANHFLNISLATFEPPKEEDNDNKKVNGANAHSTNNDVQRLIELSLLQQLFYRETNAKTPDSRLKKIQRQKSWKLLIQTIGTMAFALSIITLFIPNELDTFFNFEGGIFSSTIAKYIALVACIVILFFIIYKSSRSIIGLSIKKLNLQGAEIEIDKSISKSILNNHIDEIIYFFEATNYNVVIIEDLDRFGDSEVFTKLREINLLINNSKKINRDIVFIYAIKDDMFQDKDRAKFFDYMLPVIPIVNFSNSGDRLKKMLEGSSTKIDNDLIDDLSLFIDDMRLLYNIMNEFHVYEAKISKQLDMNKLLAIIVYKNLYPKDFTELSENSGVLFNTINSKNKYIQETISEIDNQIKSLEEKIKISEEHFNISIIELRTIYNCKVAERIGSNFSAFKVNGNRYTISDFTTDVLFDIIKSGRVEYYFEDWNNNSNSHSVISYNFHELEKDVHPSLTYNQREAIILDKKDINRLKKELEQLITKKGIIRKSKLKDIISSKQITIESKEDKEKELIDILLRNGYINENYLDYISIFHEGALSKTDYQFLINVKRELEPQFDYVLNKKDELLKRINRYTFEKECILNFDIVDTLLENSYKDKIDVLFKQLANEHEQTLKFINEYIDRSKVQGIFINKLCSYWQNLWRYILLESSYTDERKEQYFLLILKYANLKDLVKIFNKNESYIANYRDFFIIDMDDKVRLELVESLGIIFKTINSNSPKGDLQFLMDNYYYEINRKMLKVIIPEEKFDLEEFNTKNYSYLRNSGLNSIVDYVEENINSYVEEILIGIEDNTKEDIESYTLLLNNSDLHLELKEKLIKKTDTIISDISTIDGLDEAHLLFQNSKIEPTWENVQYVFVKDSNILPETVIAFLNRESNAIELSKNRMTSEPNEEGIEIYSKLCNAIIHGKNISDISYGLLLKSIPWCYNSFDASLIPYERMKVLIEKNMVNRVIASYNYLQQNYKGLNVQLIEKDPNKFIEQLDQLVVDLSDMELLLKSSKLNKEMKFQFINSADDSIIINSNVNSRFVLDNVLLDARKYSICESLHIQLINRKELPVTERINLFLLIHSSLNNEEINSFLISLGFPYDEITNHKKSPKIKRDALNENFMKILIQKGIIISYSDKNDQVYHSTKNKEQ